MWILHHLQADIETDEVYAQMVLIPTQDPVSCSIHFIRFCSTLFVLVVFFFPSISQSYILQYLIARLTNMLAVRTPGERDNGATRCTCAKYATN